MLFSMCSSSSAEERCNSRFVLYSPFADNDRAYFKSIEKRVFSRFGASRKTPRKGHLHSGIDLSGKLSEEVFPIAPGIVERHYWIFPNLAVAVKHILPDGSSLYSVYVHLADVQVREGDQVDEHTRLGRIFNKMEIEISGFRTPHLHLEIRKDFSDNGKSSFSSMSQVALEQHLIDPIHFLNKFMK
jgi:murein DD-endopeptidase MepM/ murein hydrolase activator NlpD